MSAKGVKAGDVVFVDVPNHGLAPMHVARAGKGLVLGHFLPLGLLPSDVGAESLEYGPDEVVYYLYIWSSHLRDVDWPIVRGQKGHVPGPCGWPLPLMSFLPIGLEGWSFVRKNDPEYEFGKTLECHVPVELALQLVGSGIDSPGSFEDKLSLVFSGLSPWTYLGKNAPERAREIQRIWEERDRKLPWSVPDSIFDAEDPSGEFSRMILGS